MGWVNEFWRIKKKNKKLWFKNRKLYDELSKTRKGEIIGRQLLRSGTSVGANYGAACRAKSDADFIYKIEIVEEESDESAFWLELISESNILGMGKLESLLKEANELTAIFTSSGKTVKQRIKKY